MLLGARALRFTTGMTEVSRGGRCAGHGACSQTGWCRSDCLCPAQCALRGGGGSRGFLTSEQELELITLWTFPVIGASVALDVAQWRETQHGQPSVEHFTYSPQKLQTGKHLTKQVWSRLLKERGGLLFSSFTSPALPPSTMYLPPFAVCLPLGCVHGCSMS